MLSSKALYYFTFPALNLLFLSSTMGHGWQSEDNFQETGLPSTTEFRASSLKHLDFETGLLYVAQAGLEPEARGFPRSSSAGMVGVACSLWLNLPLLRLKIISYSAPGVSTEEPVSFKILHFSPSSYIF